MSLKECQNIEREFPHLHRQVVSFSPGKKCEEVNCEKFCGCNFLELSISVGKAIPLGCGTCECTLAHRIHCPCTTVSIRKEIRDLTHEELFRYQNAVKELATQKSPTVWRNLTYLYEKYIPQSHGNQFFLPWHRYFLRYAEMKLQEIDCSVTIPYFDWTLDVGNLASSIVWQANFFGGNGDKTENYCVKHHPFQNYLPPYWETCLKRNFNSSVILPNAVDIEKILRSQSFTDFSYQLEKVTGLFHLFVGGHMASPGSPYDPIFLSLYAFVDKLWYDWIIRDPNNVEKFPQEFRYVSMIPFSVTPDDVLMSMTQLCVSYMQITEGASCVSTQMQQGHSDTSKQIFDVDGYDTNGYDKYGFDRMGWNRNGFNRDSFNRDGFDAYGYDRQGYNRYGIDRHGCNKQSVCFFDVESGVQKKTTPWEDFNEIGFRQTGFDFHGYDIYGFDINGIDKENCSRFFQGPFYPKFMKNTIDKLRELKQDELNKISRICPDVSTLPVWWITVYWLNRDHNGVHLKSSTYTSAEQNFFSPYSHTNNLWLAPTPDERYVL